MTGNSQTAPVRAPLRAPVRGRWRVAAALVAAGLLVACAPAPEDPGPPGAWWVGRTSSVRTLLTQLVALEGTPLASAARQLDFVLPDCEVVGARAERADFAQLVLETRCIDADDALGVELRRVDAEIAFALPVVSKERVRGEVRFGPGALVVDVAWPQPDPEGFLALIIPGETPAGPDRLASRGRLVHAHVRPQDGIDISSLVPAGGQADRLFALRSDLFAGAVLDGTWESAVYLPEQPGAMPGVALALGIRMRRAAVAAADRVLADLQETWGVRRTELRLPAGEGACLPDLNILPDFAPCYVATDAALVVAWNPTSLHRALATEASGDAGSPGRIDVDLAMIERADVHVAQALGLSDPPARWPWRRLRADAGSEDGVLRGRLTLALERRAGL